MVETQDPVQGYPIIYVPNPGKSFGLLPFAQTFKELVTDLKILSVPSLKVMFSSLCR